METQEIFEDNELDSEWNKYLATLSQKNDNLHKKYKEKRKLERRERATMDSLKNHVRGLSMVRFELENDFIDSLEDSDSESDLSSSDTVKILDTPVDDLEDELDGLDDGDEDEDDEDDEDDEEDEEDEDDEVDDTDHESITTTSIPSSRSNSNNRNKFNMKPIDTNIHYKSKADEDSQDTEDSDEDSTDDDTDDSPIQSIDVDHDHELKALKEELNKFKKQNSARLRRTKSQEEVLLSVLKIDEKDIDSRTLKKYTQKAINDYLDIQETAKKTVVNSKSNKYNKAKNKYDRPKIYDSGSLKSPISTNKKKMTPIPESPIKKPKRKLCSKTLPSPIVVTQPSKSMRTQRRFKKRLGRLADPYEEEWNGLDPDDYVWYDNLKEGECYDDKELSLRNRRIQYLVVMAIDNEYCTISDLTYKQNELLLLYQQTLRF